MTQKVTHHDLEPVQARTVDQLTSFHGHQCRPALTELARVVVAKWQWVVDPSTGELHDRKASTVAGCIEEVGDAMEKLDYFTTQDDGQATGVNWAVVNESELIEEIAK